MHNISDTFNSIDFIFEFSCLLCVCVFPPPPLLFTLKFCFQIVSEFITVMTFSICPRSICLYVNMSFLLHISWIRSYGTTFAKIFHVRQMTWIILIYNRSFLTLNVDKLQINDTFSSIYVGFWITRLSTRLFEPYDRTSQRLSWCLLQNCIA